MNQCDAPPESRSTKPDASFSPPLSSKAAAQPPNNNYQLNQLNSQANFETNRNASAATIGDPPGGLSPVDGQPASQPNAQEIYQLLRPQRLYLDAQEQQISKLSSNSVLLTNSSLLNSPAQPLDSISHSAFTSSNHSSAPADESYKQSGSNTRFTNRIMLHFEKTNKCHRESSQVSFSFLEDVFNVWLVCTLLCIFPGCSRDLLQKK